MQTLIHFVRRRALEIAIVACVAQLGWLMLARAEPEAGDLLPSLRNASFPQTYIGRIHLDLTSPNHWVRLTWIGPEAAYQDAGPFRSSPGTGAGTNDCDDPLESNCPNSLCTPKGVRNVEGLQDHLTARMQSA